MKKALLTLVAAAILAAPLAPALAQDDGENKFVINGMVRGRIEYFDNYFDLTDHDDSGDPADDSFSLIPYRTMIGVTGNFTDNVSAHIDLQYAGTFGDEFQPEKDILLPVGQGITPYLFATQGVQLYQGYVDLNKIGGSNIGLRVGRAEHTYGTELFLGDNDYYNGLTLDGFRGSWMAGKSDLNAFYYKTFEGNSFFDSGAVDSNLFGVTYDYGTDGEWGKFGGYVLAAQELGDGDIVIDDPDSKLYTVGAHWMRPTMAGEGTMNAFDWNVEVAFQTGDEGDPDGVETDLSGFVAEGWFGWNFGSDTSHGRVHAGLYMSSGDDDFFDDENGDFTPLFGDFHANNRLGDLDYLEFAWGVANLTNLNVGYDHWFDDHSIMAAVHYNMMTEDEGFTDDKLGLEFNAGYAYRYSKNVTFSVLVGQFQPDTGLEEAFGLTESDPVTRINGGLELRW